ncbi:MAG TPA: copper homeostasis protein CutC [Bacteroidales bacterium]|nr:copper homeostasis protein CutC [Bacteroidales bacterium]
MLLEICANSLQSAINAQKAGAQRIELCENLEQGGTTPSYGLLAQTRKHLNIKINVLIRPRSGDFLYSDLEYQVIQDDIRMAKQLGADGVVCGILLPNGDVDVERTKILVELSKPMSFTFHRAFDFTNDPFKALEDIISIGADRILTSGQQPTAIQGLHLIWDLIKTAKGRIIIMPGSGVKAENIEYLTETGATELHMSGTDLVESGMTFRKPGMTLGNPNGDYCLIESNIKKIKSALDIISRQ